VQPSWTNHHWYLSFITWGVLIGLFIYLFICLSIFQCYVLRFNGASADLALKVCHVGIFVEEDHVT
jgi:hypothetical protein